MWFESLFKFLSNDGLKIEIRQLLNTLQPLKVQNLPQQNSQTCLRRKNPNLYCALLIQPSRTIQHLHKIRTTTIRCLFDIFARAIASVQISNRQLIVLCKCFCYTHKRLFYRTVNSYLRILCLTCFIDLLILAVCLFTISVRLIIMS